MSSIPIIRIGGSLPFKFDRTGLDVDDWVLTIYVRQYPTSADLITPRIVIALNNLWEGYLTSTETSTFTVTSKSPNQLIGVLENASTDEKQQIVLRFHVGPPWDA